MSTTIRTRITQALRTTAVLAITACIALTGCSTDQATAPATTPDTATTVTVERITEDDPRFDCRTMGNNVCGPNAEVTPGCYVAGELVTPWTRFDAPRLDPLYAAVGSPCA